MSTNPRTEASIFQDLASLCCSPGYVHAIAYFVYRDGYVSFEGEFTGRDTHHLFSPERLIRTKIASLLGLLIKRQIDFALPLARTLQQYITQTEALLRELHDCLVVPMRDSLIPGKGQITQGEVFREAIFYGGESAYVFQYRDLAIKKFHADSAWLCNNKSFTIDAACHVAKALERLQNKKLMRTLREMRSKDIEEWTILPALTFSCQELVDACGLNMQTVGAVLDAFSVGPDEGNDAFTSIHEFNVVNATPLLRTNDGRFLSFHQYSFAEAIYESPFYWMNGDDKYKAVAMNHRGDFVEQLCFERLTAVFGAGNVFKNVEIFERPGARIAEIDVLAVYGNRAIVVQAKSKRLTLEARMGNDRRLRDDFKLGIQDAYDQGRICADELRARRATFADGAGRSVSIPAEVRQIYVVCVVADNYPALSYQARQFLVFDSPAGIAPPLVFDVFTVDVLAEMLPSPLYFLSYIDRRAFYWEKILASHELVVIGYHLKHNLWVKEDVDMLVVGDDFSADLDVAMAVRRDGVPGVATPEGILTRLRKTVVGKILDQIERNPEPSTIDFGCLLLMLDESTVRFASKAIGALAGRARTDHRLHDSQWESPVGRLAFACIAATSQKRPRADD
jgi:hypothetical protein